MGPLSVPPHVHPLAGWSFRRVVMEDEDTKREIPSLPPVSAPPIGDGIEFNSSFNDDPPARMGLPSIIVEPSILATPSQAPSHASLVPQTSDEPYTASFDSRMDKVDEAFVRGEVAVTDLPRATPRKAKRTARKHSPTRALAFACMLIVGGSFVGVGLGLAGKRAYLKARVPVVPAALADASVAAPVAAPPVDDVRSVAELEKAVPVRPMPEAAAPLPRKPALVDPEAVRAGREAPLPRKATVAKAERKAAKPAPFRLDIPVGDATVARAFTLASPARVVVDLEGGTTPKEPLDGDGTTTKRVRFGHPRAGTSRVVVELADGVAPSDLSAKVSGGRLALTFK
jgi:hypothetical protein